MDVRVEIKDEFGQTSLGISEIIDFDNECIASGTTNTFDLILDHIKGALRALTFSEELIEKHIGNGIEED